MDWLTLLIILALVFGFLNGFHDSSNVVATIIFSRVMHPRWVLLLTALAEFAGPFLFGVAVAKTIGADVILAEAISPQVLAAALLAGIVWNLFTWYFGIPSSSSHALIGGMIGATLLAAGASAIRSAGLVKILVALFLSPVVGLFVGFLITRGVFYLARNATLRINWFFKNAQILTGVALALSHGTNDAQKTMGVIVLGLLAHGSLTRFEVPLWVVAASAGVMALGTSIGGWRLIRTLGRRFYKIRPVDGFCTQVASALVILGAALWGGPLSTTQVVSATILGVGSAHRVSKVRWNVAGQIALAWVLTIPVTALLAAALYLGLKRF
ncbi:inorganic phosphate transporter [Thermanaerothrix sp.]|jgi:PiT family inorganic phosphate transporter|uniref:inorganic phosphate transporter n=1 Tax=Thermanaerothrix sp. TaxID=2972675 RepID=UPI002ADD7D1B|nr:inorganic phosphate transporter [Thermanaerothrix sp.]